MQLTIVFINTFCRVIVQIGKVGFYLAMRTYSMNDAHNPYEHKEYAMGENIQVGDVEIDSNRRRYQETPPYIVGTMRSLIKAQEE